MEPVQNFKNELSKSVSSNHIKNMSKDIFSYSAPINQEYGLSKSQSGMNVHFNGNSNTHEQSSSSASGISSPSNVSNNSNREEEEK